VLLSVELTPHLDLHVAAALDPIGGVLGVESFATNRAGYRQLFE